VKAEEGEAGMNFQPDAQATNLRYLVLIASAAFTAENMVEPILPIRVVMMQASSLDLGVIVGIASVSAFLLRIPSGFLCRRVKFGTLISLALLGEGVAYLLYGIAPSQVWMYPARILWGMTAAIFMVGMTATISNASPSERIGWAMGTYLTSYGLGTMLGPLACSLLLSVLPYSHVMVAASLLPFAGFLILCLKFRSTAIWDSFAGIAPHDRIGGIDSHPSIAEAFSELLSIVSRQRVALAGVLYFLFSVSITFLDIVFVVHAVTQLGLDPSVVALMLTARGIANTVVRTPAGTISDRFGQKVPFVISFGSLMLSYLVLATSTEVWLMACAMVVLGAAWGMGVVLEWATTQNEAPAESRPIASTFLPLVWDIAHFIGAVTAGALALFVPATTILFICAALMLIAILTVLALWPSEHFSAYRDLLRRRSQPE
jgi:MFS family permease